MTLLARASSVWGLVIALFVVEGLLILSLDLGFRPDGESSANIRWMGYGVALVFAGWGVTRALYQHHARVRVEFEVMAGMTALALVVAYRCSTW